MGSAHYFDSPLFGEKKVKKLAPRLRLKKHFQIYGKGVRTLPVPVPKFGNGTDKGTPPHCFVPTFLLCVALRKAAVFCQKAAVCKNMHKNQKMCLKFTFKLRGQAFMTKDWNLYHFVDTVSR